MADVIYDSGEISAAVNKMRTYGSMLAQSMEEYLSILEQLCGDAVNDDKICARIASLRERAAAHPQAIETECERLRKASAAAISSVEALEAGCGFAAMDGWVANQLAGLF